MGSTGKKDPISENYYVSIEVAEKAVFVLFLVGGLLSFGLLFLDRNGKFYELSQVLFLLITLALFALNHFLRLSLIPQAEEKRVQDFLSSAYGVQITSDTTKKYYNNSEKTPVRRTALQLLENLYFTKNISAEMLKFIRPVSIAYLVIWFPFVLYREADLEWILVASGVLFSEEVFSKYIRLEWLRCRTRKLYDELYRTFHTGMSETDFEVSVLEKFVIYERIKSTSTITLSSKTFDKLNDFLSDEWKKLRQPLEST